MLDNCCIVGKKFQSVDFPFDLRWHSAPSIIIAVNAITRTDLGQMARLLMPYKATRPAHIHH